MNKSMAVVAAGFVLVAALVATWWLYASPKPRPGATPYQALMSRDTAFAEADALYKSGQYAAALQKYEEALARASGAVQEGQIKIKIAHTLRDEGKKLQALRAYKELADNERYLPIVRAYAIQNMATLFNIDGDPAILEETFKAEPYMSMRVIGDNDISYKNLYEYASSLYPLAFNELRSASWYATQLLKAQNKDIRLSDDTVANYKSVIREKLANADKDIVRVQNDENERTAMPELLKRRANLLGQMVFFGGAQPAEADRAYAEAMNIAALSGTGDGFMRYFYAVYLARYGSARASEVVSTLEPFYKNTGYSSASISTFFRAERENRLNNKAELQNLARIDPAFKNFLREKMAWRDSDLVAK